MSVFKPIQVILTVIIISVVSLVLVSSDILDGGDCTYGVVVGTLAPWDADPSAAPPAAPTTPGAVGSAYGSVSTEAECSRIRLVGGQTSNTLAVDADATNNYQPLVWTYELDVFPGFRSLAMLVPLVLIGLVIFAAWRSGSFGGRGGGMG